MSSCLYDVHEEIARRRAEGSLDATWEQRALEVARITGATRYVHFDPEGFVRPADYVEVLQALAEVGGAKLALGAFEVASTSEAITFRGSVAGREIAFSLPPFTTDWFDANLLFELNRAIAASGPTHQIVDVDVDDGPYLFVMTASTERALKRHPMQLIWTDEEVPPSEPPDAGPAPSEPAPPEGAPWEPVFQPMLLEVPAPLAHEALRVVGLTRHPRAETFAMRLRGGSGAAHAALVDARGSAWFAPEGCVDMAWSPDGATTYVLFADRLEAWVWGRDEVRATYPSPRRALSRVIVSPCGRFVGVLFGARGRDELVVLETSALREQVTHHACTPAAVAFSEDGESVIVLRMEETPSAMTVNDHPMLWLGGLYFLETRPDGPSAMTLWRVEADTPAEDLPAIPDELLPVRFEGRVAIVDVPGFGEVRGDPEEE